MRIAAICLGALTISGSWVEPALPLAKEAKTTQRCILMDRIAGRRIADKDSVYFEMSGKVDYTNRLQGGCPGLERIGEVATISVVRGGDGGQLCKGDLIKVADPIEVQGIGFQGVPNCRLGDFTAVPKSR